MDVISQTFLFYGYAAAWIIVFGFVLLLVRRGQRIDHELARLKSLVEDKEDKEKQGSV
jgi:CcmD family protein